VLDGARRTVSGGTVYLVPAADVTRLAQTPLDLTLAPSAAARATHDEPLEDVIDARAASECAPRVAAILAEELGHDGAWATEQVAAFRALAAGYAFPAEHPK
jgi:hypothetical protein